METVVGLTAAPVSLDPAARPDNTADQPTMSRGAGDQANLRQGECGRGSWWLATLKDTPVPGLYPIRDFIEESELNPVQRTYGFKSVGRRGPRGGDLLLPGAYDFTDFTQEALKRNTTYSFKNSPRPENDTLGVRDKDLQTSPCDYDVAPKPVQKVPCKHVMFRSTVQRLVFPPRNGPAPCDYSPDYGPDHGPDSGPDHGPERNPGKSITSSFRSTVPRLHCVHSKTPGPGAYGSFVNLGDRVNPGMSPLFSFYFRNLP